MLTILFISNLIFGYLQAATATTVLNVHQYGAVANDGKDDTAAFQKAVDKLASLHGGKLEIPAGEYCISHVKFFGKRYSNIEISGSKAIIRQTTPNLRKSVHNGIFKTYAERYSADGCFVFDAQVSNQKDDSQSIKNIAISGLTFISDVEKKGFDELSHQISAHGVSNFSVSDCRFIGFLGDGIAINGGTDFRFFQDAYNKDVVIKNCAFDGVNNDNRQGISIYYSDGFLIDNCTFKNTTRKDMPGAIDIEPDRDNNVVKNGIILNCKFENIGGLGAVTIRTKTPSALNQYSQKNFEVSNCDFRSVVAPVAIIGTEDYTKISPNIINVRIKNLTVDNSQNVIKIIHAYGVYIEDSSFKNIFNEDAAPITEGESNNIIFKNCTFQNIAHPKGLYFGANTKNISVVESVFTDFAKDAITFEYSKGIGTITNNSFVSNRSKGTFLSREEIFSRGLPSSALIKNNRVGRGVKR